MNRLNAGNRNPSPSLAPVGNFQMLKLNVFQFQEETMEAVHSVSPVLVALRQEYCQKFQARLGYRVRLCFYTLHKSIKIYISKSTINACCNFVFLIL